MPLPALLSDYFMTVLVYETQHDLMFSLARFQEFYENATLKGTKFTREDLLTQQPGYYTAWNGCNFDWSVVDALSKWDDLDEAEKAVLACLDGMAPRYVVGAHKGRGYHALQGTLKHERAHALWAARPDYREGITDMLDHHYTQLARDEMRAVLIAKGYHPSVHLDEIQAYHQHGWDRVFGSHAPMCGEFVQAQSSFIQQIYREVRSESVV